MGASANPNRTTGGNTGSGDMTKTVYDANNDGRIDAAESASFATRAASADAVAWTNITGKPSAFPPTPHTASLIQWPAGIGGYIWTLAADGTASWQIAPGTGTGTGTGDMLKSTYDSDGDGKVNAAVNADNAPWAGISGKPSSFAPGVHKSTHTSGGADALSPLDIGAEPAFAKQTAFNKAFGTAPGTVMEGNRSFTKADVGLSNVDNTSDVNKPVSAAAQQLFNAKQDKITAGTPAQYLRGDLSLATLSKAAVGLANVDNTADAAKPVSTAQAAAIDQRVPLTRTLTINGITLDLSADRSWTVDGGTGTGTVVDASATVKGVAKLSVAPALASDPIAVGNNDPRMSNARTPTAHKASHAATGPDPLLPADIGAEPAIGAKNTAFNKNYGTLAGTTAEGNHSHTLASLGAEPAFNKSTGFNKNFGTVANTVAEGNHGHTPTQIGAEPAFAKNTAFNKNFGTAAGTVAEGNHTHTGLVPANRVLTINGTALDLSSDRSWSISGANLSEGSATLSGTTLNWGTTDILAWPSTLSPAGMTITGFTGLSVGVRIVEIPAAISGWIKFSPSYVVQLKNDAPGTYRYARIHCKNAAAGSEQVNITWVSSDTKAYGSHTAPLSGNITITAADMAYQYINIYHNGSTKPAFNLPAGVSLVKLGGNSYVASQLNMITLYVASPARLEATVAQGGSW